MRTLTVILGLMVPCAALGRADGGFGVEGSAHPDAVWGCNLCHSGGSKPVVKLVGPAALPVGGSAAYAAEIHGGAGVLGGFDAMIFRADGEVVTGWLEPGMEQQSAGPDEVTHAKPRPFTNGSVSFEFVLHAPSEPGALTLSVAGNSTNGDGNSDGDFGSKASLQIEIVAELPRGVDAGTPEPIIDAEPDSGGPEETAAGGCGAIPPGGALSLLIAMAATRRRTRVV